LCKEILIELSKPEYKCRAWLNVTGTAISPSGNMMSFGLRGSSDIIGIISGRFIAVEVKTGTGRLTKEQDCFLKMISDYGGVAITARSLNDIKKILAP
jgi:hypothetical protein